MVNIFEMTLKPWVVGIIIKEIAPGVFLVMTQKRFVNPKYREEYDPINHGCWEAVAGLLNKPGEDCVTAILRELREECGMPPDWKPLQILGVSKELLHDDGRQVLALTSLEDYLNAPGIFWGDSPPDRDRWGRPVIWANGGGDSTVRYQIDRTPTEGKQFYQPLCGIENLGEPQHWLGYGFGVVVPSDWEPNYDEADGEASSPRWWPPDQLLQAMRETPRIFMGPEIPAFELLCEKLLAGTLFE